MSLTDKSVAYFIETFQSFAPRDISGNNSNDERSIMKHLQQLKRSYTTSSSTSSSKVRAMELDKQIILSDLFKQLVEILKQIKRSRNICSNKKNDPIRLKIKEILRDWNHIYYMDDDNDDNNNEQRISVCGPTAETTTGDGGGDGGNGALNVLDSINDNHSQPQSSQTSAAVATTTTSTAATGTTCVNTTTTTTRAITPSTTTVKKWPTMRELPKGNDIALCCYICKCSEERKQKYGSMSISCANSGNTKLFHRFCCHEIPMDFHNSDKGRDWISELQDSSEKMGQIEEKEDEYISRIDLERMKDKFASFDHSWKKKHAMIAKQCLPKISSEKYNRYVQRFQKFVKKVKKGKKERIGPLVVLDVFSGIGTTALILKKLQIAVKTMICVEHDRIATHVAKYNHDSSYNESIVESDGIKYVEYSKFESLENDEVIDDILYNCGEIDLIVGGPPCVDHSEINGQRQGRKGDKGQYLKKFGELIHRIKAKQNKNVFFLSENVCHQDKEEIGRISDVYGIPPFMIDASHISPCKRARFYWINLPFENPIVLNHSQPLLENGCVMPVNALGAKLDIIPKANTLMASKHRLDDSKMMTIEVVQEDSVDRYIKRTFTTADRERMLGFPVGYVTKSIDHLHNMIKDGFKAEFQEGEHWYYRLDCKYHWTKDCQFKFLPHDTDFFALKILHEDSDTYFNLEENCKHLVGNAWSVPVVERLLAPLQKVCTRKIYRDFDYEYEFDYPDSS